MIQILLELSDRLAQDPGVRDPAAVHFWTGTALVARGLAEKRNDEALENYAEAILQRPDFADAYVSRGVALADLKRFQGAVSHCRHRALCR